MRVYLRGRIHQCVQAFAGVEVALVHAVHVTVGQSETRLEIEKLELGRPVPTSQPDRSAPPSNWHQTNNFGSSCNQRTFLLSGDQHLSDFTTTFRMRVQAVVAAIAVALGSSISDGAIDVDSTSILQQQQYNIPPGSCRCTPPNPCWNAIQWQALNASVNGKLMGTVDELQSCFANLNSSACTTDLASTDNEFWLSAQPFGYLHTGQFGVWNISSIYPSYSVAAETEEEMQATVAFAYENNLRLVIKGTGHDWYGRSAGAGSLMLWTHPRNNITFNDSFVPDGGQRQFAPVEAVTVQAGVQFQDLYTASQLNGRLTIGGTCDSVGVGGWVAKPTILARVDASRPAAKAT